MQVTPSDTNSASINCLESNNYVITINGISQVFPQTRLPTYVVSMDNSNFDGSVEIISSNLSSLPSTSKVSYVQTDNNSKIKSVLSENYNQSNNNEDNRNIEINKDLNKNDHTSLQDIYIPSNETDNSSTKTLVVPKFKTENNKDDENQCKSPEKLNSLLL